MLDIFYSQAFGIMLTIALYIFGSFLYRKTNFFLFSPLFFSSCILIIYIKVFKADTNTFLTDLSGINLFLGPLIVSLAVPIAKQIDLIKNNLIPILVGSIVGAFASIVSVLILGKLFGLDREIIASLIPKSSTTPIAIEISNKLNGIRAITVAVVIISAILGSIIVPLLIKITKIKDPRIIGMGLGSTAHAVGTAKAFEIDPHAGAISGVALVFVGLATVIIALFL